MVHDKSKRAKESESSCLCVRCTTVVATILKLAAKNKAKHAVSIDITILLVGVLTHTERSGHFKVTNTAYSLEYPRVMGSLFKDMEVPAPLTRHVLDLRRCCPPDTDLVRGVLAIYHSCDRSVH